jgi:hypothetical protein
MIMKSKIRRRYTDYILNRKIKNNKRIVKACNLRECKSIGLLFNATQILNFEIVKDLVKELSTPSNKIKVLGYVEGKDMIDHYLYRKGFEFFTRQQLNWFQKPISESVDDFVKQPFDVLINLSLDKTYPIQYIVALSKARFKAGMFTEESKLLDFMIDIKKEKETILKLQEELALDKNSSREHKTSYDSIANIKTNAELQLNFLINQLVHYLSQINN